MVAKAELGTKRQCPKCGTRFYDLGNDDPITCIACGHEFVVEQILKPRRPVAEVAAPKPEEKPAEESEDEVEIDEDLEVDVDEDDSDESDIDSLLEDDDDDDVSLDVVVDGDGEDDK